MSLILKRHSTNTVKIGNILVGSNHPVAVQSMTNTDTEDVHSTAQQIIELAKAGSELVRITVNTEKAAANVPYIKELVDKEIDVPIIGDFHYNGHTLLTKYPDCAKALAKYRVNPGNVGFGKKHDPQFTTIIEQAIRYDKPVRIGVNWGSLDQELSSKLMDDNSNLKNPESSDAVLRKAMVMSALLSAKRAEEIGLKDDKIIISCKVSRVQDLILIYRKLAAESKYALHLGLTEAGIGSKGIVASSAALAVLLQEGIGDTIRISLTPEPNSSRTKEVIVAQELLQTMGIRMFTPMVTACPGCGRTTSSYFQELAMKIQNHIRERMPDWKKLNNGVENINIAVMGCIVNGPGESKHSNIGISLPGNGESPAAPVFIEGKKFTTLRGDNIADEFIEIVEKYVRGVMSYKL